MIDIPIETALRIARRVCDRYNIALILPGDPRRDAVVELVAKGHQVRGTGVTREHLAESVTVTLPGIPGPASYLLGLIPVVGKALQALGESNGRTAIYLSPAAMETGARLLETLWHELGHVGSIAAGGLSWCLAFLLAAEVRGGAEGPCYGTTVALRWALEGIPIEEAAADALASLEGYGLDDAAMRLVRGIIASAVATILATGDHGGVVAELRAELAAEGIDLEDRPTVPA